MGYSSPVQVGDTSEWISGQGAQGGTSGGFIGLGTNNIMIFLAGLSQIRFYGISIEHLSQRPDTYVSGTSGLGKMLGTALTTWRKDAHFKGLV